MNTRDKDTRICKKCEYAYTNSITEGHCTKDTELRPIDKALESDTRPVWCSIYPKRVRALSDGQIKLIGD